MNNALLNLCLALGMTANASAGLVDNFVIGLEQPVSNGVPARGAGNIEVAGASDVYTLTLAAPTNVFFDEQGGGCSIQWHCEGPSGTVFLAQTICVSDPGAKALDAGVYTITVNGNGSATGTYGFTLWDINPPQLFTIGLEQPISNGVPEIGAGNIEEAGAIDVYTLELATATDVYCDEQSGGCSILWRCDGPNGVVFTSQAICASDPGVFALDAGTYSFTVSGADSTIGTYAFEIWEVNRPQVFVVGLEQPVSQNVPAPGAGFIEEPGAIDQYQLTIDVPTTVYFDEINGGCGILWSCIGPTGSLFADQAICATDPGAFTLLDSGVYTMTVHGNGSSVGSYSFNLVEVSPPQVFKIALNDVVSLDVPETGAGNLEEAGAVDVYHLAVNAGQDICFDEISGPCGIVWRAVGPDGAVLFTNNPICVTDPGSFVMPIDGTCTIIVNGNGSTIGPYSFFTRLRPFADLNADCVVSAADLAILLGAWGPCVGCVADLDDSGSVDASDLALLLGSWS